MKESSIGNIIAKLRKEKGLTQKKLAEDLHVTDKAISKWEVGKNHPDLETIYRISQYFNVSFRDLLQARADYETEDSKIVDKIINEFDEIGKKKRKYIKRMLITLLVVIVFLVAVLIFTNTYNKFRVYRISFEDTNFAYNTALYVETNIRDTMYLGDIKIRSVDTSKYNDIKLIMYYKENNKEVIVQSFDRLDNILFKTFESYVPIKNLSDYKDNFYMRVILKDKNDKIEEYETKVGFELEFSNNKLKYNIEDKAKYDTDSDFLPEDEIKKVLLENGFVENGEEYYKNNTNYNFRYFFNINKIQLKYENNNVIYKYMYDIVNSNLDSYVVSSFSNDIIENYEYDIKNGIMNCHVGACSNHDYILSLFEDNILYLIRK